MKETQSDLMDNSIEPGYIWTKSNLFADVSFPIYKSIKEYEIEVKKSEAKALNVFTQKTNINLYVENELEKLTNVSKRDINGNLISNSIFELYDKLGSSDGSDSKLKIKQELSNYIRQSFAKGIIDTDKESLKASELIFFNSPNLLNYKKTANVLDLKEFIDNGKIIIDKSLKDKPNQIAKEILNSFKIANFHFSKDLTEQQRELARKSVTRTIGIVKKGDLIIKRGVRVNELDVLKLQSYQQAKNQLDESKSKFLAYLGSFGHVCLIFSFILIYLIKIRKKIFRDLFQFSLICTFLIAISILSWLTIEIKVDYPIEYLIVLPALSMLAAIVFDSRTGFYVTVTMSLLIAGIRGNDYTTAIIMMFSGTLAGYTVKDIQNRTQMFRSIFFIMIGFLIPIIIFGLERNTSLVSIIQKAGFSVINAIISPLLTYGLLFLLDKYTNFATDLRIQEYDNLSHPLLIKLNEVAPGTYQHSITLAMLSERCASAIGANHTFVQVASYFHDIGKMQRPEYFAENLSYYGINKHDVISPKKSAKLIIDHVTEGVKIAKEYQLPERIIDIIEQHHGTTLVQHFYAKAVEQYPEAEIREEDFRYPGPKPNTKESAIVMICDTAEAVSRLSVKTAEELEELVNNIVKVKFDDGQFDQCDITTKELEIVKKTLLKNLIGLQHKRVEYKKMPKQDDESKAAKEVNSIE